MVTDRQQLFGSCSNNPRKSQKLIFFLPKLAAFWKLALTLHKKWTFEAWLFSVNVNTFTVSHLLKKSLTENFIFYALRVEGLVRTDCKTFSNKRYILLANFAQGLISPMSDLVGHKFSLTLGWRRSLW